MSGPPGHLAEIRDTVLDNARIGPGDVVLDAGTGAGLIAAAAAERVGADGAVVALDTSVDHLEELRRVATAPNISFLLGSTDVLPLPDESADVACARFGPPDVRDEAEAARELFRVLRHGGRVSIFEPSREPDEDPGASALNIDGHDLERHLHEAGFVDVTLDLPPGEGESAGAPLYLTAAKP